MGWPLRIAGRHCLAFLCLVLFNLILCPGIASAQSRSAVPLAAEDGGGRRVALVIGNAAYEQAPALTNPKFDAELMAATLEDAGFAVTELIDATQSQMKRALLEFGRALRRRASRPGCSTTPAMASRCAAKTI